MLAKRLKIPFLTGDREFKDLDGIEYVKLKCLKSLMSTKDSAIKTAYPKP